MNDPRDGRIIAIGRIQKAKGLRGEVKVTLLTDFPERFESLGSVFVTFVSGEIRSFRVEQARLGDRAVYIKLAGVDDRNDAENLRGAILGVSEGDVVPVDEDSIFFYDLEGMKLVNADGDLIGTVVDVERYPASDVLVVQTESGRIMVPAVKRFIKNIDRENGRLTVDLPDGLPDYPKGIR